MEGERKQEVIIPSIQLGVRKQWREIELGTREWWREYRRFMKEPPVPGEAWLEPARVRAGEELYLKLHIRIGKGGIGRYGHIAVETPFGGHQLFRPGPVHRARTPYLWVSCTNRNPNLDVTCSGTIVDILAQGYPLNEGDVVTVHFADPQTNPLRMPPRMLRHPFAIALDRDNTGRYQRIASFPVLEGVGGPARCVHVIAPAVVSAGEPFSLRALALDGFDGNPCPEFQSRVRLLCTDPNAQMPLHADASNAKAELAQVALRSPGIHTITVIDEQNGLIGQTPPIAVEAQRGGWRTFFGDIHGHNDHCDGAGTIDEYYRWLRDVRLLDFGALTNHVEGAKRMDVPDFWPVDAAKARGYHAPGQFVTFLGFEWGGWEVWGDKCVYYDGDDAPWFPANERMSDSPKKLFEQLKGRRALVIPHHAKFVGRAGWAEHDPQWEPLVEIYSMWGSSECHGERSVQAAWERGCRLGVIGSSDNQTGHPGTPPGGLACVLARELTRGALFDALQSRRCYATTGARILLDVRANGVPMGSMLKDADELHVRVAGTAPIERLEILRNSEVVRSLNGGERVVELRWRDLSPRRGAYYYVRVTQSDGHLAWSSPVWVD